VVYLIEAIKVVRKVNTGFIAKCSECIIIDPFIIKTNGVDYSIFMFGEEIQSVYADRKIDVIISQDESIARQKDLESELLDALERLSSWMVTYKDDEKI
jgi:hypothetical protein